VRGVREVRRLRRVRRVRRGKFCDLGWQISLSLFRIALFSESFVTGGRERTLQSVQQVAKHFSELICWQLARDLRREVFTLTSRVSFNQDFNFRAQLRDASSSAAANISEGFGRLTHREFHRFLDVSRTSVAEVENGLGEAVERRYLTDEEIRTALNLCKRTRVAASRLMGYLKQQPDPPRNRWPRRPRT
jgi:four helix bundle protein